MTPRKDGIDQHLDERTRRVSSDYERVNDEDNLDTRDISPGIEEGDEDYDDEELDNEDDELTEADFEVDGEDDDGDEEEV